MGREDPPATDAMTGMTVLGCVLGERLGRGSSGAVYRARQTRLDRDVAVKVVPVDAAAPGTEQRFEREVRAVASLHHPHVVPLHDAGAEEGVLVLVMGLVEGSDVRRSVADQGPFTLDRALSVAAQVGSALDASHDAGVVHRDVKPGNVLLARDSAGWLGAAYLADFGLARDVVTSGDRTVTGEGQWVGTPAYAAPEQLRGHRVGPPADLYALAGLTWFMLTGRPPGGPVPPDADPRVRAVLAAAAAAMTEDPADRPATAAALLDALEAARSGSHDAEPDAPAATEVVGSGADAAVASEGPTRRRAPARAGGLLVAALLVATGWIAWTAWPRSGSQDPGSTAPAGTSAPSISPSDQPSITGEPAAPWPSVGPGSDEDLVLAVQHLLVDRGADLAVDGVFGPATRREVGAEQRTAGLAATGSVDARTWERLTPRLFRGDVRDAVRAAQVLLLAGGYEVRTDGRFGANTLEAVRAFQRAEGLSVDGVVGPRTWLELTRGA